ncbi:midkine b [Lates japonicus]
MSLDDYFSKMPHTKSKKKAASAVHPSGDVEPAAVESEEANVSEVEASAEVEEAGSEVNPSILSALSKITDNITKSLDAKVDTVFAAIREQTSQMQALAARVGDAETRISGVEDTTDVLQAKVTQLEKQITDMADHIDDLENRSRRCNLSLVRLPEGTEGKDALTFMETWLPSYLNLTTKTGKIKLDRAHRSLAPRPGTNQRARPIIMKLHNFADKQRVMAAARRLATEPNQPADRIRVSLFNDYSAAVAKRRKAFDEVKSCLRRKNVDYALLYPATLRLSVNTKEKRFNTPEAAATYVESLP